ncbi:alpha/beta hydrolase [Candidatus Bipolaricaulota bacterium]|nr:alpha/beta hydrolase [Candidatus Bipolaricaulota bacterium]
MMNQKIRFSVVLALVVIGLGALALCGTGNETPTDIDVQEKFDYLGPVIHHFKLESGKTVAFVDEGKKDWTPVLYVGGAGTASRVMHLTDFVRSLRKKLQLRLITVGRNGFGETGYVPDWGYSDYAKEVKQVLNHLGIGEFVGIAISGGGPYLAAVAAEMPYRIISLHMAAAVSQSSQDGWNCKEEFDDTAKVLRRYATHPLKWWDLGEHSALRKVPSLQDTANEDGTRSFYMGGQLALEDAGKRRVETAVTEEYRRFCQEVPDTSGVTAPTFLYYSPDDPSVGMEHAKFWKKHLSVVKERYYPGEGHTVQYRHWSQIMLDMAGFGDYLVVCHNGTSKIVSENEGKSMMEDDQATSGICAWQTGERD